MEPIRIPLLHISAFAPQIAVILTAAVVLLVDLFKKDVERINITLLALLGLAAAYLAALRLDPTIQPAFTGMVIRDGVSLYLDKLFLIGTALIVLMSHPLSQRLTRSYAEYIFLLLTASLGMMCISVSADLMLLFLGIEIVSLCLYLLTGFDKKSLLSGEASMKYLLLGSFASGFLIYGIAFVFGVCRTTNMLAIGAAAPGAQGTPLLVLGFALMLAGLGFKISLVPFHAWAPDVYQGAPTPITAWIATGSKVAGFAALVRVFSLPEMSFAPLGGLWTNAVWILSLLTMIVGNAGALAQADIKRMLAYSSIAHGGYLSMAFVAHNEVGLQALLFYLAAYLFMTAGAFACVNAATKKGEECKTISSFTSLARQQPWLAGIFTLFLLSLAGMPPTAGFFGKVWLFGAAIQSGYYALAVIGVLTTMLSFYYYLRIAVVMWMKEDGEEEFDPAPLSHALAISIAAFAVLLLGFFPNLIVKVINSGLAGL
ncbi:MAG: NADH-quinone oxidoreductase subunit N [Candidatus Omnitrophota bacterium]